MPHCVIEYSKPLENSIHPAKLIEAVQNGAINSGLFEPSHIRARAIAYDDFVAGYQVQNFIHVTLKILSGRDQEQKKNLSEMVLSELYKIGMGSISMTVEVKDIERETYAKKIISNH